MEASRRMKLRVAYEQHLVQLPIPNSNISDAVFELYLVENIDGIGYLIGGAYRCRVYLGHLRRERPPK